MAPDPYEDFLHVYPLNDLREHDCTGADCWCKPSVDEEDKLIVHNSMDGRERHEDGTPLH